MVSLHVSDLVDARVWLDDVEIQPAKRKTRTDNSCLLFGKGGYATRFLGKATGAYRDCR